MEVLLPQGGQEGEWRVYMNMLYWGEGVRPVTTWRHHRFTFHSDLFPDKLADFRGAVLKGLAHAYKLHKGHDLDEVFDEVHEGKSVLLENTGFLHFHIVTHFTHRGVSTVRIMKEYGSTGEDTKANNEEGVVALSTDHMQGLFIIAMNISNFMDPKQLLWLLTFMSREGMKLFGTKLTENPLVNISQHQNMSTQMLVYDGGSREISSYTPPLLPSTSQYRNLRNVGLSLRIGLSSPISLDTDSLSELLKTVVQRELNGCDLVFLHDDTDLYSVEVQELLLTLPNSRQVVVVRNETDLAKVVWVSPGCGGYLILMEDMEPLLYYANTYHDMWGYRGRYVMVSQRVEQVEALVATRNGKKTEHILGVVKGGQEGEWRVYMNMLYWGEGVRPVTTWRHHRFTSQSQLFPDKLSDFRGAVLKVATFEFPPSIMYYEADNGTLLYHYGKEITIVQKLAQTLNFSVRFAEPADGDTWGYLINDSWTGMMGELVRNEADMGLGNVFMMGYRYEVITFSAPFSHESVCFMARVEPPVPRWQAPSFPFHPWTWLAFLVGIIVSGPILFVVAFFSGQFGAESTSLTKISFSWYYAFGLHFNEPQFVEPRMNSTRIFVLFLWLYTMILTITYSTNLTAFLLVQKPAASMETTRELYESGREMALICQGLTLSIAKSRDPYIKGLMNVYKTYKHHKLDEVFDRVLKGKSVFLENEEFLNFHIATQFTHRGVSRVRLMKECLTQYNIIIALQRNSALKRKIDIIISWVHESGLVGHENRKALEFAATTKKYGSADKEKSTNQEEGVVALSIDHMQGLFILVVLGCSSQSEVRSVLFTLWLDTEEAGLDPLPSPTPTPPTPSSQHHVMNDPFLTNKTLDIGLQRSDKFISGYITNVTRRTRRTGLLSTAVKSTEAASLSKLLASVVQQDMNDCRLVLIYDASELYSDVVQDLMLLLPNPKQVVEMRRAEDLLGVVWVSKECGGYLLLLDHTQPLLTFTNTHHDSWDYHGRYVMVSQRVEQVEALVATRNGKKTEHILGVVKGGQEGEWRVYMNMLYWGEGVRPVTTWRHHRFTSQSQLFPDKLDDLQGTVLKVSTFEFPPSIIYYRDDNGTLLYRYGEDISVVKNMARVLNFTAHFRKPVDGYKWGSQKANNGTGNGMMGELMRDEADIGIANLFLNPGRYEVLTLSAPYAREKICFLARVEPPLPRWQALAFPFHPYTWLAILVGFILSGPVLFLLAAASSRWGDEAASLGTLDFSWYYSFGLHFCESQVVEPRMNSTRIFVLFLWLYTMILTIAYSTNLTAFLVVHKPSKQIETVKELSESNLELSVYLPGLTSAISSSLDPHVQALSRIHKVYTFETPESWLLSRVLAGKSVLSENISYLKYHIATHFTYRGISTARVMKECLHYRYVILALQRNSPLKKKGDKVIAWLTESDITNHEKEEASALAASVQKHDEEDEAPVQDEGVVALTLDHTQGVFIITLVGWFAGYSVFIIEYFLRPGLKK
ncbi:hypothetical protein Pcinc_019008 [Petrolisthes cinctipes]|uniref:Ionotropic glutamate receptor L-glutamate and glycine-binding domain-containing protein n=1 Tax=Petrolisthes cinctipes TaxID=88211 RepID=A0AAE1KM39_PETCI|nr:hypothetical protein Pcinc_019008 [Petrolisthes cinctipes]